MKRPRVLVGILAACALLVVVYRFVLTEHRGPRQRVASVRAERRDPLFDERAALLDLSVALEEARLAGDVALGSEILRLRADILLEIGARQEARQALAQALEEFEPEDHALELSIAEMCDQDGEVTEASERVERLLERAPTYGPAWVLRGRIVARWAEERLSQARSLVRGRMLDREVQRAMELVDQLVALDLDRADRHAYLVSLRDLLGSNREKDYETLAMLTDDVSRLRAEAREAHAKSLAYSLEPEAVAAMVRGLSRGMEARWALQLGTIARFDERVEADWRVAAAMIPAAMRIGEAATVRSVLRGWKWQQWPGTAEFYEDACVALYEVGAWDLLTEPIQRLRHTGGDRGAKLGSFFAGMAAYGRGQNEQGIDLLRTYLRSGHTYYEGDVATAWFSLADMYRAAGRAREERNALLEATERLPVADGEAWLRLAALTLQASHSGYREAERQWTRGMSLLPRRAKELQPQWLTLSDEALEADRKSFEDAVRDASRQGRPLPSFEIGPATTYRFGVLALEQRRFEMALRIARSLLDDYPDLLPAIDLALEAELALRDEPAAAELALARLALVGRDEDTLSALARVGPQSFSAAQVVDAMRADPTSTGRLVIARSLNRVGRWQEALNALDQAAAGERVADPEQRLEAARALYELGRPSEARERLAGLASHPILGEQAIALDVEITLDEGDPERLADLVERSTRRVGDRDLVLRLADELARRGELDLARRAARALDEDRKTRGGDLLLLLARIEMAAGNDDAALEALERAEAFALGGEVELARLLLAVARRQWLELRGLVERVRAARIAATPLDTAVLALLAEELAEGERLAREGLEALPHGVQWQILHAAACSLVGRPVTADAYFGGPESEHALAELLRGRDEYVRDPREILALLLVVDDARWAPWILPRLAQASSDTGGTAWAELLATRTLLAAGDVARARERLDALLASWPRFGPAWDLALELAIAEHGGEAFHPDVNALRARRAEQSGISEDEITAAIAGAVALGEADDLAGACARIEPIFAADPTESRGREVLARLFVRARRFPEAAKQYHQAIAAAEGATAARLVAELLDALREGADEIGVDARRALLAGLADRFARLPSLALARAELELERDAVRPGIALTRALEILGEFRTATRDEPLDALEPGSALRWVRFLVRHSPEDAEALVRAELESAPGSVDLWLALAEILERSRRTTDAVAAYVEAASMTGSPRAHIGVARLIGHLPDGATTVDQHLDAAERAGDESVRALVDFHRARSVIGRAAVPLDPVIETLERLWEMRAELDDLDELELGNALVLALFTRRTEADLVRIGELLRELAIRARGSLLRDYLHSLHGLTLHLEPREPPPDEEPTEADAEVVDPESPSGAPSEDVVPPGDGDAAAGDGNRAGGPGARKPPREGARRKREGADGGNPAAPGSKANREGRAKTGPGAQSRGKAAEKQGPPGGKQGSEPDAKGTRPRTKPPASDDAEPPSKPPRAGGGKPGAGERESDG